MQKGAIARGPTSYQFVASNDNVCNDGATWTVLCEDLSNTAWSGYQDTKYCRVKPEMKGKYRCLGLRVLKNQDPKGWVTLRNIRVWERIESPWFVCRLYHSNWLISSLEDLFEKEFTKRLFNKRWQKVLINFFALWQSRWNKEKVTEYK